MAQQGTPNNNSGGTAKNTQIMGDDISGLPVLEITVQDDQPGAGAGSAQRTQTQAAAQVPSQKNPTTNSSSRPIRGVLSPKPAPAFIRGGKQAINRTNSLSSLEKRGKIQQQTAGAGQQPALSPVHRNNKAKQRRQFSPKQQRQLSPRERARIQRSSSAKMQRRRSSMGGGAALPHISRRISIGYNNNPSGNATPAVATKNSWGQKPLRRSSLSNHARKASPPPPAQQKQQQQQQHGAPQAPAELDYDDSFSRRSSLSSHGSYFSDSDESGGGRGGTTYLSNVSSLVGGGGTKSKQLKPQHQKRLLIATDDDDKNINNTIHSDEDDDDSTLEDDMSYANDSIDVRNKKTRPATSAKLDVKKGSRLTKPNTDYLDDVDSLLADDDDTYAADSLDLRKYRKQKQKSQKDHDYIQQEDDDDYDSMGDEDTYAADSLDLRRNSRLRHVASPPSTIATTSLVATTPTATKGLALDDSAADSAYSCAADSLDLRTFRKKKQQQQQQQQQRKSPPRDLEYGKVAPTRQDLGYSDNEETPVIAVVTDTKQKDKTSRQINDDGSCSSSSYDAYSYAADSLDLRNKFGKIGATTRTATTTEGDDDSDDYDDDSDAGDYTDTDSNKTPMDYMTRVVMGYSKKNKGAVEGSPVDDNDSESDSDGNTDEDTDSNKTPMDYMTRIVMGYSKNNDHATSATAAGGDAMRRMSMESTASSVYSYACDSVVMKKPSIQKKAPKAASSLGKTAGYANREGYDDYDDCSDYSDDESHHGGGGANNPYLSAMLGYGNQNKPKLHASESFDTGMDRRMSCDSYANDSVDMRRKGKKSGKKESARRESMDSLVSGISTSDVDPQYLQDVLGYAMDASAGTVDQSASSSKPSYPRDLLVSATYTNMMDSMTSIGSEGDWALSPSRHQKPKARMPAAKAMQKMSGSSLGCSDSEESFDDLEY